MHVAVRSGVDEPVLLSMASADQKPKRILMLFPGGDGIMQIKQKAGGTWFKLLGNYLIRTRARFVDAEDIAVSVDMPSDQYCCANDRFRLDEQHAADVGAIIAALAARFPGAEFYLVGTSKGTVSAAALGARLGPKVAGVVLTSTVTQRDAQRRGAVAVRLRHAQGAGAVRAPQVRQLPRDAVLRGGKDRAGSTTFRSSP